TGSARPTGWRALRNAGKTNCKARRRPRPQPASHPRRAGYSGEANIPPERLAAKRVECAERFKALEATASAQPGDDPRIAALKADVQKAIDAGELAKADTLLADAERERRRALTEQRHALARLSLTAADISARRGEIALTRLRYR